MQNEMKLELSNLKGIEAKIKCALTEGAYAELKQLHLKSPLIKQVTERVCELVGIELPHPDCERTYFQRAIELSLASTKEQPGHRDAMCKSFIESCIDALMPLPNTHVWSAITNHGTRVWDYSCEDFTSFQVGRDEVFCSHLVAELNPEAEEVVRQSIRGRIVTRNILVCYGVSPAGQSRKFTFKELEHVAAG